MSTEHLYAFQVCRRIRESSTFLLYTDPGKQIPLSFFFWGFKHESGFILVDVGFPWEAVKNTDDVKEDFRDPKNLLANIGVDPSDVKKIILTHLHWDHVAGLDLFTNATFFLQKRELEHFTGPFVKYPIVHRSVNIEHILKIIRLNYEGRLVLLDGDDQIVKGVDVILFGGHTPGTQGVRIHRDKGSVLISGDITPFYRNLRDNIPPGICSNLNEVLVSYNKINTIIDTIDDIVPGHDPEVTAKFPFDQGVVSIF